MEFIPPKRDHLSSIIKLPPMASITPVIYHLSDYSYLRLTKIINICLESAFK
jgi:hypothetical protein